MTVPRRNKKVKEKKRVERKKRQIYSASKKKKRGKTQRGKKSQLVLNTNARVKRLERQLAAEKKKIAALRKWKKRKKGERKKQSRSEAAKRGWTKRRAREAKELQEFLHTEELSQEERDELRKVTTRAVANRKQLVATYIKKLPDYLLRPDKEEFLVERKENLIMHRLIIAKEITGDFDSVAYDIAEEYDREPYEIYSLWHGYELEE